MGERLAGDHISHLFDKDLEAIKHQVLKWVVWLRCR